MQVTRRKRCQTRTRPRKNACVYGARVSGATIFAYVNGNPISYSDPYGLNPVAGAIGGAEIGTAIFPGVGTVIGGAIGAGIGLWIADKVSDNIMEMASPGSNVVDTGIAKDYGAAASAAKMCGKPPPDRCEWLKANAQNYTPAQVKATEKAWGCRRSRAGR